MTGQLIANLVGHTDAVRSLILLNDLTLASGSYDNSIKFWNLSTGMNTLTLRNHRAFVISLIRLRNGYLVSGSTDKTIKMWYF